MAEATEAPKLNPARQLVLHAMLSLFISAAVFVVVSYMVLIPQLAQHEKRIRDLEAVISEMQQDAEASAVPPAPEAPAAAPAAAPAVTPAPAPAAPPPPAKK